MWDTDEFIKGFFSIVLSHTGHEDPQELTEKTADPAGRLGSQGFLVKCGVDQDRSDRDLSNLCSNSINVLVDNFPW